MLFPTFCKTQPDTFHKPRLQVGIPWLLPLLVLLATPMALKADQYGDFTYSTDGTNITITAYTGLGGAVAIPSTINGLSVTSIGTWAFYSSCVTNVIIPDSVVNIDDGAFFDCEPLANVTVGSGVTNIGNWAFAFCTSLTSVNFRGNVPSLGGDYVFYDDVATVYHLPGTTGWRATFAGLPTLLWNPQVLFTYTTNSDGITLTITGYTGPGDTVTVPVTINFLPVTSIGNYGRWWFKSPASLIIPNSVFSIGEGAFYACCGLTNVTIGDGVTNIGNGAFNYCGNLTAITVDALNSVYSSVDGVLFNESQTTLIKCPEGKAGNYTIPNGVANIGGAAFKECVSLTSVIIPNSVVNIGTNAFSVTDIATVTIGNGVTNIGNGAFDNCNFLTAITVDALNSAYSSADGVLFDKSQTTLIRCPELKAGSYTIPNSVINIENDAFYGCYKLTSVVLGNNVTNIGDTAFLWCSGLINVYCQGNAPGLGSTVFYGVNYATVYYLPGTTGWGSTFGGLPTALWLLPNPTILNFEPNFGVQINGFSFTISWATNVSVVVEACADLANPVWQPVQTNTLTSGSSCFSDSQWTNYPTRFYRLRSP